MESQLTASSRLGSKFLSSLESQKEEGKAGEHEDDMDNNYDNIDDDVNDEEEGIASKNWASISLVST